MRRSVGSLFQSGLVQNRIPFDAVSERVQPFRSTYRCIRRSKRYTCNCRAGSDLLDDGFGDSDLFQDAQISSKGNDRRVSGGINLRTR